MYRKGNTALLADLIWTCGQDFLFCNIFGCFCLHLCMSTNCDNLNFLLIYRSQYLVIGHNMMEFRGTFESKIENVR